jgi:hypothetical protein
MGPYLPPGASTDCLKRPHFLKRLDIIDDHLFRSLAHASQP